MADSERIGPYRVIRRLGAGGMGEVVLAHDDRLDRRVAIKRLHDGTATPERRERFRREARIAARLDHPAIVRIHDVLHEAGHDYLIMEYVEGQTLRARCDAGPMAVSELLGIAHQLALGMAAAHDLGVIHRDLKAENVLITRASRAKLTDFGIAKLDSDDTFTARGAVIGTFRAMSPEQALSRPIDHRSDLFSFGILLYETLAGESPFRAETPFLTVQRLVHEEPRPITELVPSLPAGLASLVHQLLAKEPLLRPRDFHEVAEALIELAGQACDAPCRVGSSLDGLPRPGEDARSTEDSVAPVRSLRADEPPPATPPATLPPAPPPPAAVHAAPRRLPWRVALIVTAALGAVGLGYALRGAGRLRHVGADDVRPDAAVRAQIIHVAVLAPVVSGAEGHPEIALIADAVLTAVEASVQSRDGLYLIPRSDIKSYLDGVKATGHPLRQGELRHAVGANEVIEIDLACSASSCTVTLKRDSRPASQPFQINADGGGHPDETVAANLSTLYSDHPAHDAEIEPSVHDRYVQLVRDYWADRDAPSSDAVLAEIDRIRRQSPRSIDVRLFEAELLRHQYLQTRDDDTVRRATEVLDEADHLLPDSYRIKSARFDIALSAGRLDKARDALDWLALRDPDSSTTHLQLAKLHYQRSKLHRQRGELHDQRVELEAARGEITAASQRDSFSWHVLYHRALVSRALHDWADTRAAILELLERSPGNYGGLALLAREDRRDGKLTCAETIYQGLVDREPLYDECLNLGYVQELRGQYPKATASFLRALAIRPDDPLARLDRAESLLLAGHADAARNQLRELHELLARKPHDDPGDAHDDLLVDAQALAYLGGADPVAANAARTSLHALLTPTAEPYELYVAAQVHAYLGDHDLAVQYVTQYLNDDGSPADLRFPWFADLLADLQRDPILGPKLSVPADDPSCETGSAR